MDDARSHTKKLARGESPSEEEGGSLLTAPQAVLLPFAFPPEGAGAVDLPLLLSRKAPPLPMDAGLELGLELWLTPMIEPW